VLWLIRLSDGRTPQVLDGSTRLKELLPWNDFGVWIKHRSGRDLIHIRIVTIYLNRLLTQKLKIEPGTSRISTVSNADMIKMITQVYYSVLNDSNRDNIEMHIDWWGGESRENSNLWGHYQHIEACLINAHHPASRCLSTHQSARARTFSAV
jgi:hypothetical protein